MIFKDKNIDINYVRNNLGEPSSNLADLCRSDKINVYARYKPIYVLGTIFTNPDQYAYKWWQGFDANCGCNIPSVVGDYQSLIGNGAKWTRIKPEGGGTWSSVFALSAFAGYNTEAEPIVRHTYGDRFIYERDAADTTILLMFIVTANKGISAESNTHIGLSDFTYGTIKHPLLNMYIGVIINDSYLYMEQTGKLENVLANASTVNTQLNYRPPVDLFEYGEVNLKFVLTDEYYVGTALAGRRYYKFPDNENVPDEVTMELTGEDPFLAVSLDNEVLEESIVLDTTSRAGNTSTAYVSSNVTWRFKD